MVSPLCVRRLGGISGALALMFATTALAQPAIERMVKVAPGGLYELVLNPANDDVYVAAVGQNTNAAVVRLDGETLEVEGTIDVSEYPLFGLALNSRTQMLYGTSTRIGAVSVVNLATGEVVANIRKDEEFAAHVRQIAVDEGRNKVYVSIVGGDSAVAEDAANEVWVIDGATNILEKVIPITSNRMAGLALDTERNRLFTSGIDSNEVIAVDIASGEIVGRWASGGEFSTNVAYDAAGKRLFVTHQQTDNMTVLNSETGALIATVPTGDGALAVAFNPRLNQIYVTNRAGGTTTVINGADYSVLANLPTGTLPQSIAIDPDTNLVYVTNKARGVPRGSPAGTPAPVDEAGDTVTIIRP